MTVAIFGDVGGHLDQLERALSALGVAEGRWPAELHVVQVGDLLGGVDDVDVVSLVEPFVLSGQWTQLLGNWDSRTIGGHDFVPPGQRNLPAPAAEARVASWFAAGLTRWAATVSTRSGRRALVTHAGVTHEWWQTVLEGETDPATAAARINGAPLDRIHQAGEMLQGSGPAGPVWASTAELWTGWLDQASPWPQVHGHSSAWSYRHHDWARWTPKLCTAFATMDERERSSTFTTARGAGSSIVGVDNSVYAARNVVLRPLIIPGAAMCDMARNDS